jgi:hypothetical protein
LKTKLRHRDRVVLVRRPTHAPQGIGEFGKGGLERQEPLAN